MGGTLTASWSGSQTRLPQTFGSGFPAITPLAVPVANTAGQWLIAVVSWRQDTGVAGTIQYPSSVAVSDDAHNFWIPVRSVQPQTGVVRCAIWMAPAARAAGFVYFSPTAYQSALTATVAEFTADCPWYTIDVCGSASTNQGTSVTLSETLPSGSFALGVIAFDNLAAGGISISTSGWSSRTTTSVNNGSDHNGDLEQIFVFLAGSGGSSTISGSSTGAMDWADLIVTVHGIADAIPFPYATPLENWPVLVTEIAAGGVLNANPLMLSGATDWSATNGSVAAANWPAWNPWPYYQTLITQSLTLTPSGSATTCHLAGTDQEPVSPQVQYSALAYVYSVAGWPTVDVFVTWFDASHASISTTGGLTTAVPAGAWTQLTWVAPLFPPSNAAFGIVGVSEFSGSNIPSSAVLYIGYCGFGPADSYEGAPPDEIQWTDFSSRNFTEQSISLSRGVQYEQQSLEAGTMTVTLANNDYAVMFGNTESAFWPTIGDTDVPVRLRAIWPGSLTPYYVLFSGFTDDIDFGYNAGTRYSYAAITASDAWSRLTQQLLGAAEEDVLQDDPVGYWVCSQSGANLAPGASSVVSTVVSPQGAGSATASFTGSAVQLSGDPGASCWQSTTTLNSSTGVALGYFPSGGGQALPPVSGGVTVEFWVTTVAVSASQPTAVLAVCTCWSGQNNNSNGRAWEITIDNLGGAGSSAATITVYDQVTGASSSTSMGAGLYLTAGAVTNATYMAVTFTQTSLTVAVNPGAGTTYSTVTTVTCNLAPTIVGFSWGGAVAPNGVPSAGFMSLAVYGVALYDQIVPPARLASHYATAATAFTLEIDTSRLARIAGYCGFTPVLAMRGTDLNSAELDLSASPNLAVSPDLDVVTGATDTNGQVVSDYFTNIAQSTLAFLFTDGPGALQYRRRLEADNRVQGQWVAGEQVAAGINANPLNVFPSTSGWGSANGATLTSSGIAGVNPLFFPYCGLFHGDGVTSSPQITYGSVSGTPVTVGAWYTLSCWVYSPQGFPSGLELNIRWFNSSNAQVGSSQTFTLQVLAAGTIAYMQVPATQAPATTAYVLIVLRALAVPASSAQCYVTDVVLASVNPVTAGGDGATTPEAPYLVDVKMSSDRAQLYNQAVLTQYGTNTQETFRGTDITFTPSSGVIVQISNQGSINQRGDVPYTATLYLDNTAQGLPYYLNCPSMEDFGNWIVQTLGAPLFRPLTVTITPAATTGSTLTGLQAEVGDTVTFRRRHLGVPEVQILTYLSKLSHSIDIQSGTWNTQYELSPFPQGSALQCDDVIQGCLTGGNVLPW